MKLVTVAVFYDPNQARIALNFLESDGVRAVLENENISQNALVLGQAVGQVRLLVEERDIDRARAILEEDSTLELSDLEELALQAKPEDTAKPLFKFFYPDGIEDGPGQKKLDAIDDRSAELDSETYVADPNNREVLVERAFRGSIFFLVLIPFIPLFILLLPFALLISVLLFQILLTDAPLRPKYRRKLIGSLIFHLPVLLLILWLARILFQSLIGST